MKAGRLWETSLVGEAVKGFDACLRPSTAFSGHYDGVADTAIRQPAGAAAVQTFTPCQVQLCGCSQLCPCISAVRLGFIKRQLLWDGVMEYHSCENIIFKLEAQQYKWDQVRFSSIKCSV